jgi:hypothetical protein
MGQWIQPRILELARAGQTPGRRVKT